MAKLTDTKCRTATASGKDEFLGDGGGLYLRVRPGERTVKVWLFRFKSLTGSGSRWFEIDTYPKMPLIEARLRAAELTMMRRAGIDPVEEKKAIKDAEAAAEAASLAAAAQVAAGDAARITVTTLFDRWASVDLVRRKDGGAEIRRMFEKDVLPTLGAMLVEDVRKGHITGVTDALLARGVTRMAKLIFSLMRQMFRFAVDRDIIEFEPTAAIRKAKIGGKDTERDRVLTEDEIKVLVRQLPKAGLSDSAVSAVWLALSTLCRIGELMSARWEHIDFERRTFWIPPENSKNKKAHTIALSDFALAQFQCLKDLRDEAAAKAREKDPEAKPSPWVYPNRNGAGPVCPKTITKQLGDRQRAGLPPMKGRARVELSDTLSLIGGRWGPHDCRRTGATMMVALGVLPEVAERCLNHVEENKVKRIYQRHSYENEMRQAWALLGDRLALLTSGAANVVTFKRTA